MTERPQDVQKSQEGVQYSLPVEGGGKTSTPIYLPHKVTTSGQETQEIEEVSQSVLEQESSPPQTPSIQSKHDVEKAKGPGHEVQGTPFKVVVPEIGEAPPLTLEQQRVFDVLQKGGEQAHAILKELLSKSPPDEDLALALLSAISKLPPNENETSPLKELRACLAQLQDTFKTIQGSQAAGLSASDKLLLSFYTATCKLTDKESFFLGKCLAEAHNDHTNLTQQIDANIDHFLRLTGKIREQLTPVVTMLLQIRDVYEQMFEQAPKVQKSPLEDMQAAVQEKLNPQKKTVKQETKPVTEEEVSATLAALKKGDKEALQVLKVLITKVPPHEEFASVLLEAIEKLESDEQISHFKGLQETFAELGESDNSLSATEKLALAFYTATYNLDKDESYSLGVFINDSNDGFSTLFDQINTKDSEGINIFLRITDKMKSDPDQLTPFGTTLLKIRTAYEQRAQQDEEDVEDLDLESLQQESVEGTAEKIPFTEELLRTTVAELQKGGKEASNALKEFITKVQPNEEEASQLLEAIDQLPSLTSTLKEIQALLRDQEESESEIPLTARDMLVLAYYTASYSLTPEESAFLAEWILDAKDGYLDLIAQLKGKDPKFLEMFLSITNKIKDPATSFGIDLLKIRATFDQLTSSAIDRGKLLHVASFAVLRHNKMEKGAGKIEDASSQILKRGRAEKTKEKGTRLDYTLQTGEESGVLYYHTSRGLSQLKAEGGFKTTTTTGRIVVDRISQKAGAVLQQITPPAEGYVVQKTQGTMTAAEERQLLREVEIPRSYARRGIPGFLSPVAWAKYTRTEAAATPGGEAQVKNKYSIVVERCAGDLKQAAKDPSIGESQVIEIMAGCLCGTLALHRDGYMHGDINRRNLMYKLDKDGHAEGVVIDFGHTCNVQNLNPDAPFSAKAGEDEVSYVTRAGFYGTPEFAPPEDLREDSFKPSLYEDPLSMECFLSESWSLGIAFYQLATGKKSVSWEKALRANFDLKVKLDAQKARCEKLAEALKKKPDDTEMGEQYEEEIEILENLQDEYDKQHKKIKEHIANIAPGEIRRGLHDAPLSQNVKNIIIGLTEPGLVKRKTVGSALKECFALLPSKSPLKDKISKSKILAE
jgi:serine/threonine protein kinase